eukprot:CAMPEP_0194233886 /NCGR_PEP_ID=MMETSP0158-20130606/1734_1 /TAXON_ID=33649 /ORGANISM="Thalassionema nitzschioides, Strain L26-B" /LENGTH=118 /DNA_ID=CAMNT_0038966897 /DNA_START=32 /DNA_END=388 /DNA_ORIENTATION=-
MKCVAILLSVAAVSAFNPLGGYSPAGKSLPSFSEMAAPKIAQPKLSIHQNTAPISDPNPPMFQTISAAAPAAASKPAFSGFAHAYAAAPAAASKPAMLKSSVAAKTEEPLCLDPDFMT